MQEEEITAETVSAPVRMLVDDSKKVPRAQGGAFGAGFEVRGQG